MAAYVGNRGSGAATVSTNVITCVPASTLLSGDLAVVALGGPASSTKTLSSVSDNSGAGNVWTVDQQVWIASTYVCIASCVLKANLTSAHTITLTFTSTWAGVSVRFVLEEFSGILSSGWFDVGASATGGGTALSAGTTASPTAGGVGVAFWHVQATNATLNPPGSGYTATGQTGALNVSLAGEYKLNVSGAQAATATGNASGTWAGVQVVYKAVLAQSVSFTDSGAGSDAYTYQTTFSYTDAGSGADAFTSTAQVSAGDDPAAGADGFSVIAQISVDDTGSGSDAFTVTFVASVADTGAGSDTFSFLSASYVIAESGVGSDAVNLSLSLADSGNGADVYSVGMVYTESGIGSDLFSTGTPLSADDFGVGADSFSIAYSPSFADYGGCLGPNFTTNPGFEVNTTGWGIATGGETIARDTTQQHSGIASARCVTNSAGSGQGMWTTGQQSLNLPEGTTVMFSVWVRPAAGSVVALYCGFTNTDASTNIGPAPTATGDGTRWFLLSASYTVQPGKVANYCRVGARAQGLQTTTFYVDDAYAAIPADSFVIGAPAIDSGVGSDTFDFSQIVTLSDSGTGTDSFTVQTSVSVSDTGSGSDTFEIPTPVSYSDSGSGTDTLSVAVQAGFAEIAAGAESYRVGLGHTDFGTGTESFSVTVTWADGGAGAEAWSKIVSAIIGDAAIGIDSFTTAITNIPPWTDTGQGTDDFCRIWPGAPDIDGVLSISPRSYGSLTLNVDPDGGLVLVPDPDGGLAIATKSDGSLIMADRDWVDCG